MLDGGFGTGAEDLKVSSARTKQVNFAISDYTGCPTIEYSLSFGCFLGFRARTEVYFCLRSKPVTPNVVR